MVTYAEAEAQWESERERLALVKSLADQLEVPITVSLQFARKPVCREGQIDRAVIVLEKKWIVTWVDAVFENAFQAQDYLRSLPPPNKKRKFCLKYIGRYGHDGDYILFPNGQLHRV